jgi:hypothetical protein
VGLVGRVTTMFVVVGVESQKAWLRSKVFKNSMMMMMTIRTDLAQKKQDVDDSNKPSLPLFPTTTLMLRFILDDRFY